MDATKVVAGRDMKVWSVAWADDTALPADTVVWGAAWGGGFTEVGLTQEGVTVEFSITRDTIMADQLLDPVLRPVTGRDVKLTTNLLELTAANLLLATGQGAVSTVAADEDSRGHDEFNLTSVVNDVFKTFGLDVKNPGDGEAIRVAGWKCLATGSPSMKFGVASDAAAIALELAPLPDTSSDPARIITIRDIIPIAA